MLGINKIYLVGHLGSDPQSYQTKAGKPFVRLSLATNRSKKNEVGNWDSITDWHNITVWGKQGDACSQNLKKGNKVMVEGYLSHYEFTDKNGETRKQSAVTAQNIEFFHSQQPAAA